MSEQAKRHLEILNMIARACGQADASFGEDSAQWVFYYPSEADKFHNIILGMREMGASIHRIAREIPEEIYVIVKTGDPEPERDPF